MMYQKSCAVRYFPVSGAFPSTIIVVLGVTRATKMENGSVKLSTENGVAFYLPRTKVIQMTGGDARLVPPMFEKDSWDEDQSYYLSEAFKNLCHETDQIFIVEDHRRNADDYPVFF